MTVARTMRSLIQTQMIDPALPNMPFLAELYRVLETSDAV